MARIRYHGAYPTTFLDVGPVVSGQIFPVRDDEAERYTRRADCSLEPDEDPADAVHDAQPLEDATPEQDATNAPAPEPADADPTTPAAG